MSLPDFYAAFSSERPFRVSQRLDTLVKQMIRICPIWQKSTAPNTSKSRSTARSIGDDVDCNAKPLHASFPQIFEEVAEVTIDLTDDSPLANVSDTSDFHRLRSIIVKNSLDHQHTHSDSEENAYAELVIGTVSTVTALVSAAILSQWAEDGEDVKGQEFRSACNKLMALSFSSYTSLSWAPKDKRCIPDHVLLGPNTPTLPSSMSSGSLRVLATIDRKSKSFADYHFQTNGFRHVSLTATSKDGLIDQIIADGRSFHSIKANIIQECIGSYGDANQGGWRAATLHLLCQMKTQANVAGSRFSFFTSVYAFNRVAYVENGQLYVTHNLSSHLGEKDGIDPAVNKSYLKVLVSFLVAALGKAYPEAMPPKRRQRYANIYTPDANHYPDQIVVQPHLSSVTEDSSGEA